MPSCARRVIGSQQTSKDSEKFFGTPDTTPVGETGASKTGGNSRNPERTEENLMPKFKLSCEVTVSAYCEVHAPTLEEAIKLSEDLPPELSFNGSGNTATQAWLIEEADGMPTNIKPA
jgi:hypothetical protein